MPIYRYGCPKCGAEFEKFVNHYQPKVKCPHCGAKAIMAPTTSSFSLKGEGFYKNDYPK